MICGEITVTCVSSVNCSGEIVGENIGISTDDCDDVPDNETGVELMNL